MQPDAIVLVAHGSRSPEAMGEMAELEVLVAAGAPRVQVRLGYLELSLPPAAEVIDDVVAQGAQHVVVVPLMLHAAGHAKSDVPAVVVEGRARHRACRIDYARPFGADHVLLSVARRRLEEVGGLGLPLAVLCRGSSDPDANAEAYRVARLVADMSGAALVAPGFCGITWPDVAATLDQLRRQGARRIAAFAWFMATGVLLDRMRDDYHRFADVHGVEVVDAGYLGVGPELAGLVLERVEETLAGRAVPNCDACVYRRPFPGLEERVGMAIGAGHSHLAAAHRHAHAHEVC